MRPRETTTNRKAGAKSSARAGQCLPSPAQLSLTESLLDADDVGRRLKLSPRTVADMANEGRLPAYRIGIYLRFKWADIEQFLSANCKLATQGGAQ